MTDLRQAAQQALEALEAEISESWECNSYHPKIQPAITALRAALAEPEQPYDQTALDLCKVCGWRTLIPGDACLNCERAKQPEQKPVAFLADAMRFKVTLTQHDCKITNLPGELGGRWVALVAAEDDCHMKLTAPTPQREHITDGSPCWCNPDVIEEEGGNVIVHNYEDNWQQYAKPGETAQQCIERHRGEQDALMKLYATPRKPLTYDELEPLCEAFDSYDTTQNELVEFARAIERAHGIGEQT